MNELRFIFMADLHLRGTSPRNRLDDYPKALWKKLDSLVEYIKDRDDIEGVLFGGDLFDHPEPSAGIVNRLVDAIDQTSVPWWVIAGNHDLYGYNLSTLPRTALGILVKTGIVSLIGRIGRTIGKHNLVIWGASYHYGIDDDATILEIPAKQAAGDTNILAVHSTITPYKFPAPHIQVKAIKTDYDLILTGHYHPGIEATKVKRLGKGGAGKSVPVVVNPGALGRVERSEFVHDRPGGLLVTVNEKGKITLDRFSLKSEPNDAIFETKVDVPIVDHAISAFVSEVQDIASKIGVVDPKNAVLAVGKKMDLGSELLDRAVRIYDKVRAANRE